MKSRTGRARPFKAFCALGAATALCSVAIPAGATAGGDHAGPPTTTHHVKPSYRPGDIKRCPSGTTTFINTSHLKWGDRSESYSKGSTSFKATVDAKGKYLSFTTNSPSFTVYIEGRRHGDHRAGGGSKAYDTYAYTGTPGHPNYPSDTGLHAPSARDGKPEKIHHYLVCGQPAPVVPPGSCEASGSLSAYVHGSDVTSYIPKGAWSSTATGIDVVNVEGNSITNTQIPTGTDVINSIATNSVTGQSVATANNNHVYILKGTGLDPSVSPNPLTDSGTGQISFSGGSATTTGVAMDAVHNKALIGLSIGGKAGFQFLDLATNTFEPPFTTQNPGGQISEDPLVDPIRNLVLSPSEDNNYEIVNVANSTSPQFFEHPVTTGGELDSAAEDCSTGIIMAPAEFSSPSQVEIADINNPGTAPHAVFTPGSPGSWTAPEQVQTLTGSVLSAGASAASVAQGTHTGVITGEFGGQSLTAVALPTTSGAGATPAISDWVTCATGGTFSMGLDPHTLVAYQSPNGGHAIALMVNAGATQMVAVDLTKMLDGTTVPATGHVCTTPGGTLPATAETFITLP
ncbi:hypothetical protein EOT10_13015 [Streptomyces antnestii]|uniref:Uncharacterized protein n=1 Tax=Streptomyces antnestii TaxID=2494256 RepID=A0A3S2Z1C4_9ACTN|nr:hypothetical protein [Streptomyces sp. San01]RVU25189.1 hypothetical protein EOT10_13015 [Streptomyces sp. San01]